MRDWRNGVRSNQRYPPYTATPEPVYCRGKSLVLFAICEPECLTLENFEYLARDSIGGAAALYQRSVLNKILSPALNRELKKSQDKKTKSLKLRDLAPHKDAKGGAGKSGSSSDGSTSTVPTSLDEFLKRDSLPIKR